MPLTCPPPLSVSGQDNSGHIVGRVLNGIQEQSGTVLGHCASVNTFQLGERVCEVVSICSLGLLQRHTGSTQAALSGSGSNGSFQCSTHNI